MWRHSPTKRCLRALRLPRGRRGRYLFVGGVGGFVALAAAVTLVARSWIAAKHDENADFACVMRAVAGATHYTVVEVENGYRCTYFGANGRIVSKAIVGGH